MPAEYNPVAPDAQDKSCHVAVEDRMTVARLPSVAFARKKLFLSPDGSLGRVDAATPHKWMDFETHAAPDLPALFRVLTDEAARGNSYVLLGEPIRLGGPQRRLTKPDGNDPATLVQVPRRWIALDIDALPPPPGTDARSVTPQEVVDYITGMLPPEFNGVACIIQWSSKATLVDNIHVRLWYRLSRGLLDEERKLWLAGVSKELDPAIFGSHQPIYIANPEFVGGPDPLLGRRWVLLPDDAEEVPVPAVIVPPPREGEGDFTKAATMVEGRNWIEKLDKAGEQADGGIGFHAPCISAAGAFVAENGPDSDPAEFLATVERTLVERVTRSGKKAYIAGRMRDVRAAVAKFQKNDRASAGAKIDPAERVIWDDVPEDLSTAAEAELARFATEASAWLAEERKRTRFEALRTAAEEEATSLRPRLMFDTEADIRMAEEEDARRLTTPYFVDDVVDVAAPVLIENRERALAAFETRLLSNYWGPGTPAPPGKVARPQVGLAVPVGIGKTELAVALIARLGGQARVAVHVRDHGLAGELVSRLGKASVPAAVWRGFEADDPDSSGEKMCRRWEEAAELRQHGGAAEDLCGSEGRGLCPFHEKATADGKPACGYRAQRADARQAAAVVFAGNASLGMAPRDVLRRSPEKVTEPFGNANLTVEVPRPAFDIVIVDEPVLMQLVEGADGGEPALAIPAGDLAFGELFDPTITDGAKAREWIEAAKSSGIEDRLQRLAALPPPAGGRITYGMLRTAGWATRDAALADRRAVLRATVPLRYPGDVAFDDYAKMAGRSAVLEHNRRLAQVAAVLGGIADAFEAQPAAADAEPTVFLRWRNNVPGAGPRRSLGRALVVSRVRPVHDGWHVPTAVLDATPREGVLRRWFPEVSVSLAWTVATLPTAVKVRQVWNRDLGQETLKDWCKSGRLADLAGYIEARHARFGRAGGTLAIVPLAVEEALLAHWHGAPPEGIELAHFGALRGRDRWRGCSLLVVIGRPLPSDQAAMEVAGLLTGRVLPPGGYRFEAPRWLVRQPDGTARRVLGGRRGVARHDDPVAEEVRRMVCDDEILQAFGRARPYRRDASRPLQVDLLTLVGGGQHIPVDELVRLEDALAEGDRTPAEVLADRGLVVDPSRAGARALIGFLLGMSPNAVKMQTRNVEDRRAGRARVVARNDSENVAPEASDARSDRLSLTGSNGLYTYPTHRTFDPVRDRGPDAPETPPQMQPTFQISARKSGSRYFVPLLVDAPSQAAAEAVIHRAARLAGANPASMEIAGAKPSRSPATLNVDQGVTRPADAASAARQSPNGTPAVHKKGETEKPACEPPDGPGVDPAPTATEQLLRGSPADGATDPPDAAPVLRDGEPEPVPEPQPTVELTLDDIACLGRDLGLAAPTIRKIIGRLRPVERLRGTDAAVRSGIDATVGEAVRRRTASPEGVRLVVSRMAARSAESGAAVRPEAA